MATAICSAAGPGHLYHFLQQICLAPQGALPLHLTFQPPPARSYGQSCCHSRTLGQLALLEIVSHFLGRGGNFSPQICLGLCKWHFKSPTHRVHEPMGYAKMLKHFRAGSVHIQFWCLGTGTHADAQGQKPHFL